MEPAAQLTHIIPALNATVERIEPDQLGSPTPCDHFAVQDVIDHMVVLGGTYAYLFRGEEAPEVRPPDTPGRVPVAEFTGTMHDLFSSIRSPGAMERIVPAPVGELPGETFARFVAFDGLVHCWDLATATGQKVEFPDELVEDVEAFARLAITDDMRDGDTFKAAVEAPPGASAVERLVALSGRSVPQHATST